MKNIWKKTILFLCAVSLILCGTIPTHALEFTEHAFSSQAETFLQEAVMPFGVYNLSDYDVVTLGNDIPCYLLSDITGSYTLSNTHFYPVISGTTVVGLLQSYEYEEGKYAFCYSEKYAERINAFADLPIAFISDGKNLSIVSQSDITAFSNEDSIHFSTNNITTSNSVYTINLCSQVFSAPDGYLLSVPTKYQAYDWDCWAACVASVGEYYTGISKTSTEVSLLSGSYGGASIQVAKDALASIYNVNTSNIKTTLSFTSLRNYIYSDEAPIIAGYTGTTGSSSVDHMMVIKGYSSGSSYLNLWLMDPEGGSVTVSVTSESGMQFTYLGFSWRLNEYIV